MLKLIKMKIDNIKNYINIVILRYISIITTIFFICANGMGIFNKFSHFDDMPQMFAGGRTFMLGRWGLGIIHKLNMIFIGDYVNSLPIFNSAFSLILLILSIYLIVLLYDIKSKVIIFFICGYVSVFPVITACFAHMYMLFYFILSIFLSILVAFIICKTNNIFWYIFSVLLYSFAIGIYQGSLPIVHVLIILYYIHCILINCDEIDIKNILIDIIYKILFISLSIILYIALAKTFSVIANEPLDAYRGISSMGKEGIAEYINRVFLAYKEFFIPNIYGAGFVYYKNINLFYYVILLLSIIFSIISFIEIYRKNIILSIVYILLLIALPLFINLVYVMASPDEVYSMMVYPKVFSFFLIFILIKNLRFDFIKKFIYVISFVIIIMFIRLDNQCYLKAALYQQEAICYFTTLVSQIKSVDGYNDDMPVCYINECHIEDKTLNTIPQLDYINISPYFDLKGYINSFSWQLFMARWCGFSPMIRNIDFEKNKEIIDNMPHYPDYGSIIVIDGVIIVNF